MSCYYQRDPTVTWAHVEAHPRQFDSFEDPVTNSYVDTQQFRDAYGEALDSLDGSDLMSYVDYYFTETPMIQGTWVFKDDDVRQEFYELCVESGCMLSLKEIQEGETKTDKAARKAKEACPVTFSAPAPALTSAWSDEWSEDEEEEEEEEEEETAKKEEERKRQSEAKKKEEEQKQREKEKEKQKEKVSHITEKPGKEDGGKKHHQHQHQHKSKKDEKKDETKGKDSKKKKDKEALVPPPLVPGLEHPSKRTLATAHMQKYGKGDQGRRAVQHAHSRDAVMREFVELIQVLDRLDLSASDRATVNTRLDTIVTLLEHSA